MKMGKRQLDWQHQEDQKKQNIEKDRLKTLVLFELWLCPVSFSFGSTRWCFIIEQTKQNKNKNKTNQIQIRNWIKIKFYIEILVHGPGEEEEEDRGWNDRDKQGKPNQNTITPTDKFDRTEI